jgi:hypothetical protein
MSMSLSPQPTPSELQALNKALASIKGSPNLRDLASVDPERLRPNQIFRGTQLVDGECFWKLARKPHASNAEASKW